MTTCLKSDCSRPTRSRGYCESHYRHRLHTGRYGYQDAGLVRAHLTRLRDLGWTWDHIGEAAKLSPSIPYHLILGRQYRRVLPETRDALLSIPLTPRPSRRGVDSAGTRRRVQALAWMGWPCDEVARRAGTTRRSLATLILPRRRISFAMAGRVAAVYDELWDRPGPSKSAASKARTLGFHSPAAWDDETLDDPSAEPARPDVDESLVDQVAVARAVAARRVGRPLTLPERREVAARAVREDWTPSRLAKVLNASYSTALRLLTAAIEEAVA